MVIVTGDVNVSRKVFGRHLVFPLHASIQERCRRIGFDNLAPIIWHKIANAQYEMGAGGFFGKPYEPNGIIKNDIEYILFERKGGGYRSPDLATRLMSIIPAGDYAEWFRQVWCLGGASTRDHPAPFPVALAERLIRMFSFAGDTVLDPFLGTGTTSVAAARCGRNSIGSEIDPEYFSLCIDRNPRQPRPRGPDGAGPLGVSGWRRPQRRPALRSWMGWPDSIHPRSTITAGPLQSTSARHRTSGATGERQRRSGSPRPSPSSPCAICGRPERESSTRSLPSARSVVACEAWKADVSEVSETDGLKLAIEIKPVHLAVGRAIWNRFGDVRTFAVKRPPEVPVRRRRWDPHFAYLRTKSFGA